MPRKRNGEIPLPEGWDYGRDYDGKIYFIDHNSKKTTWIDPRDRFTKPQTFADCVGNELPLGWEEAYDGQIGPYYINHVNQCTQLEDPRQEWRAIQEDMLRDYLQTAQDVLEDDIGMPKCGHKNNEIIKCGGTHENIGIGMRGIRVDLLGLERARFFIADTYTRHSSFLPLHFTNFHAVAGQLDENPEIPVAEVYDQRVVLTAGARRDPKNVPATLSACRSRAEGRDKAIVASVSGEMWPLPHVRAHHGLQVHTLPPSYGQTQPFFYPSFQTLPASYFVQRQSYDDAFDCYRRAFERYHVDGAPQERIYENLKRYREPSGMVKAVAYGNRVGYVPAHRVLEFAKKDIFQIKSQRLILAQDEYNHLNNALATLTTSRTSLCSSSSNVSTKYDPDLLKSDVAMAKNRVSRLKSELEQIRNDLTYTQRGVDTLTNVEQKLKMNEGTYYNIAEAQAIMAELRNIQKSLSSGEKEKAELMQSLAKLKDDLTRLQLSESSPDVSTLSLPQEKLSTASQTDLSCDLVPIGTRLAEMAKMRLEYDEARKKVQSIQQKLADLEEKVQPGQVESDKDRLLLFQEKEQLLRELRSITPMMRSKEEMSGIQMECKRLEQDLNKALEMSNRAIADRLRLHEEKNLLLQQLKDGLKQMTHLESQLKTLSASTLSVSSSSSLGSLSTTSSKGSLSSGLSFTDIYGGPQCAGPINLEKPIDMADLHRRVERLLKSGENGGTPSPVRSQPSLSPRSSLSSVSPPVSPMYENLPCVVPPPTYEQVERDRRLLSEQKQIDDRLVEFRLSNPAINDYYATPRVAIPNLSPLTDLLEAQSNMSQGSGLGRPSRYSYESSGDPPLSPISETPPPILDHDEILQGAALSRTSSSGTNTRSVSAAVSDESVAGDSGVFEASNRKRASGAFGDFDGDTAQVQIKLKYIVGENMLNVCIERARNLNALLIAENSQVYIKAALLPAQQQLQSVCCTKTVRDLKKATFGDIFNISVPANKIYTKTLQVNVWSKSDQHNDICVGCAQVSLADFSVQGVSQKWYNILCLQEETLVPTSVDHAKQESDVSVCRERHDGELSCKLKEESSDDSTIISSQTSTLTRNQDSVLQSTINIFDELASCLRHTEDFSEEESDDDIEDSECEEGLADEYQPNDRLDFEVIEVIEEDKFFDKQTNTECAFYPEHAKHMKMAAAGAVDDKQGIIKRSQTFSPSAQVTKHQYICKLNRSDSDSAMPLYRRGGKPFERHAVERRSLRFRRQSGSMAQLSTSKSQTHLPTTARTSLDLELDLQAQHTRLDMLNSDLSRLRELKGRLEQAKEQGDTEFAACLLEDQQFQNLIAQAESCKSSKTAEEKKVEKMLRRVSKEIYKLRKTKAGNGKPDVISFKEKMAFFTRVNSNVPFLPTDQCHPDHAPSRHHHSSSVKEEDEEEEEEEEADNRTADNQCTNCDSSKIEVRGSGDGDQDGAPSSRYDYVVDRVLGVEV